MSKAARALRPHGQMVLLNRESVVGLKRFLSGRVCSYSVFEVRLSHGVALGSGCMNIGKEQWNLRAGAERQDSESALVYQRPWTLKIVSSTLEFIPNADNKQKVDNHSLNVAAYRRLSSKRSVSDKHTVWTERIA